MAICFFNPPLNVLAKHGGAGSNPWRCSEGSASGTAQVRTQRYSGFEGAEHTLGQPRGSGEALHPIPKTMAFFSGELLSWGAGYLTCESSPWGGEGPGGPLRVTPPPCRRQSRTQMSWPLRTEAGPSCPTPRTSQKPRCPAFRKEKTHPSGPAPKRQCRCPASTPKKREPNRPASLIPTQTRVQASATPPTEPQPPASPQKD